MGATEGCNQGEGVESIKGGRVDRGEQREREANGMSVWVINRGSTWVWGKKLMLWGWSGDLKPSVCVKEHG